MISLNKISRVLFALALPATLFIVAGCDSPEDNPQAVDYGTEFSADQINAARNKAASGLDINTLQIGQFVHWADTQQINGVDGVTVVDDFGQTITKLTNTATELDFTISEEEVVYIPAPKTLAGDLPISITKSPAPSPTPSPAPAALNSTSAQALFAVFKKPTTLNKIANWVSSAPERILTSTLKPFDTAITFHNLVDNERDIQPPDPVVARAGCEGIKNCLLHVHEIGYDIVQWTDGVGQKIHYDEVISSDVPYLASALNDFQPGTSQLGRCGTALVPTDTNGNSVLLSVCTQVLDFMYSAQ